MSWDLTRLYAAATWPACGLIVFIACCRLNAMPRNTRWPVVLEYSIWAGVGFGVPMLPFIGEWPGLGLVLLMYGLVVVLLCSARAWAGDVAPDEATDVSPLENLSFRQRIELSWYRLQAEAQIRWNRLKQWRG